MAHNGILFLDELPEFSRHVLEMLRQPLESGEVTVARAQGSILFPARFMLVAAMNPSAGGFALEPGRTDRYMKKLSGPLLDRIDMHVEVPAVTYRDLTSNRQGTDSATMRRQVTEARKRQDERFAGKGFNAAMDTRQLRTHCALDEACLLMMKMAMDEMGLSARAYDKSGAWRERLATSKGPTRSTRTTSPKRFSTGYWIESIR